MDQAQPLGLRGQAVHPAGVSESAHKATEGAEGPLVPLGADPGSWHWASEDARRSLGVAPSMQREAGAGRSSVLRA